MVRDKNINFQEDTIVEIEIICKPKIIFRIKFEYIAFNQLEIKVKYFLIQRRLSKAFRVIGYYSIKTIFPIHSDTCICISPCNVTFKIIH